MGIRTPANPAPQALIPLARVPHLPHLKMKMKSMSSMQKVATLSMVFMSTTSCRCSAGRKRTSFSTRIRRKVRSTDRPPPCWPTISHTLRGAGGQSLSLSLSPLHTHPPPAPSFRRAQQHLRVWTDQH